VTEYTPREIKKALVGTGAAEKQQVAYMVKMLLKPPQEHMHTDAYDALGIALCDFYNLNDPRKLVAAAAGKSHV